LAQLLQLRSNCSRKSELNLDWNNLWPVSLDQTLNYHDPFSTEIRPKKNVYSILIIIWKTETNEKNS
jgi:hypothetical protein